MTSGGTPLQEALTASQQQWVQVREFLDANRYELGRAAAAAYPEATTVGPTPLLTTLAWMPCSPVRLGEVEIELDEAGATSSVQEFASAAQPVVLPTRADGSRYESYSQALADLTGRQFENRGTYRFLGGQLTGDGGRLEFGHGKYFDGIDVGEACAHEFAAARLGLLEPAQPSMRSAVGDPCDPRRRPVNLAISTLTLRRDRATNAATCLLHWRDPQKVGHAGGLYQVLPVGVFQAAGDASWNQLNDFSLSRSMVREFAEEVLGESEDYGAEQAPIDYEAWPFAATITRGLSEHSVRAFVLGIGVDPLTLATDLMTAVVIDSELYDELFETAVATNDEGSVLTSLDGAAGGVPFTEQTVERFVQREPMQAAGAALLWSAWEHRSLLLP
jgi:hypothetical protein